MAYVVIVSKNGLVDVNVYNEENMAKAEFWHEVSCNMDGIHSYYRINDKETCDFSNPSYSNQLMYKLKDDSFNDGYVIIQYVDYLC